MIVKELSTGEILDTNNKKDARYIEMSIQVWQNELQEQEDNKAKESDLTPETLKFTQADREFMFRQLFSTLE